MEDGKVSEFKSIGGQRTLVAKKSGAWKNDGGCINMNLKTIETACFWMDFDGIQALELAFRQLFDQGWAIPAPCRLSVAGPRLQLALSGLSVARDAWPCC